jgi:predicted O-methyltransferase YrrM
VRLSKVRLVMLRLSKVRFVMICIGLMAGATAIFAIMGWWQAAAIGLAAMQAALALVVVKSIRDLRKLVVDVDRRVDAAAGRTLTETLALGDAIDSSTADVRATLTELSDSLTKEQVSSMKELSQQISEFKRSLVWRNSHQLSQVDALFQLYKNGVATAPMPLTGGWAIDPSSMVVLLDLIEQQRPDLVVEFGSGTSTVWIALTLERLGKGKLVSIEHDDAYANETRVALDRHDVGDHVDLRLAKLGPLGIDDHETPWYDTAVLADIETVDMLLVDGPPQQTGAMARYPAVPVLFDRMPTGALVLVDDAKRPDESAMIERWIEDHPDLTELTTVPRSGVRVLRKG